MVDSSNNEKINFLALPLLHLLLDRIRLLASPVLRHCSPRAPQEEKLAGLTVSGDGRLDLDICPTTSITEWEAWSSSCRLHLRTADRG